MQLNKTHLKEYLRLLYVANNRVDKKNSTNSTSSTRWLKQFGASLLIGAFLVFVFSRMADFNLATAIFFLVIMFTLIAEFLSEYAIILLDTKDNDILFEQYKNKILKPSFEEIIKNPPSRSAKLRYATRSKNNFFYPEDLITKFKKYLDLESSYV